MKIFIKKHNKRDINENIYKKKLIRERLMKIFIKKHNKKEINEDIY